MATWPVPVPGSVISAGVTPPSSTWRVWLAPRWNRSRRTPPTRSSGRWSGGALLGVPGLLAYRAVNTLDAMVGHRSARYERFGWAAARIDDLANLLPSRLSAGLATVLAPVVGGQPRAALRVWRRDGYKHPSPNAGPVEAAFAGALGRTLGGRLAYAGRVEDRPLLGDGPAPGVADVARAARLSLAVTLGAGVAAVATRLLLDRARA